MVLPDPFSTQGETRLQCCGHPFTHTQELEIDVDTTQQDTTGRGPRAAWKNAAQAPKELTTLPSKPDETEKPGLKRRRSVTFADGKSGAGTTMTTGGASTGGPIRGILKTHLPTPAASSLVTVN